MTTILAIDPGSKESAWVLYRATDPNVPGKLLEFGRGENTRVPIEALMQDADLIGIEMIQSYGMKVGRDVFETCVWIGRFEQRIEHERNANAIAFGGRNVQVERIDRPTEKLYVCSNRQAKDSDVRAALCDLFGGQDVAVGKKKNPGPLYGVSKDVWSALAVAIAILRRREEAKRKATA